MVNQSENHPELDQILLDGQQRLLPIERYWSGDFAVGAEDGGRYFWHDLTPQEHAHFLRIPFPWILSGYETEAEAVEAYNLLNFGGTPHTEDERAVVSQRAAPR